MHLGPKERRAVRLPRLADSASWASASGRLQPLVISPNETLRWLLSEKAAAHLWENILSGAQAASIVAFVPRLLLQD